MKTLTLTQQDIRRLLAAIRPGAPFAGRDHNMLTLVLHTGLRVGELSGLEVQDVAWQDQPRHTLSLRAEIAKGSKARVIPLNQTARAALFGLLKFNQSRGFSVAPDAPLLQNRFHRRLSVRDIQRLVQSLRQVAGLDTDSPTPHTLRHVFATSCLQKGAKLPALQRILGHSRLTSSQVYLHPSADDLAEAVQLLD